MEKKEFIDEFVDSIYLIGSKEDGKYMLTLSQAEQAASELYNTCFKTFNKPDKEQLVSFAHHLKNVMCSGKSWSIESAVDSFKTNKNK